MISSDVFRDFTARKINSTPGPAEFFRVVNYTVAQHLADVPVALPDLTEVLAEVARTDSVSGRRILAICGVLAGHRPFRRLAIYSHLAPF